MLPDEDKWIEPENLKKQMQKERLAFESGRYDPNGSDFVTYYAYKKGVQLKPHHGITEDSEALDYANNIKFALRRFGIDLVGNVLDVGCAMGTVTNAFSLLNQNGKTHGLDISDDAVEVAKSKYPKCSFYARSADDLSCFEDNGFDVIHAREFYPFTRTNDEGTHLIYLQLFADKLVPSGVIILTMIKGKKNFCNTYNILMKEQKLGRFAGIFVTPVSFKKFQYLIRYCPTFLKDILYWLFGYATQIIDTVLRRKTVFVYILKKNLHAQS